MYPTPVSAGQNLYGLNACYDSVQVMESILSKVMLDLIQNDPAVMAAIMAGIGTTGITGVTTGLPAAAGVVGQVIAGQVTGQAFAASGATTVTPLVIPAGDWNIQAILSIGSGAPTDITGAAVTLGTPLPPGMTVGGMGSITLAVSGLAAGSNFILASNTAPVNCSAQASPSFLVTRAGTAAGGFSLYAWGRRMR